MSVPGFVHGTLNRDKYQSIHDKGFCVMPLPYQHLGTLLLPLGPAGASDTLTPLTSLFQPRSAFL